MVKHIAVIKGDGIGPEVTSQAVKILQAIAKKFGHHFEYTEVAMGACAIDLYGNSLPDETIAVCLKADAILLGAIGDPKYDLDPNAKIRPEQGLLKLRKTLKLFTNIRPTTIYPCLAEMSPLKTHKLQGVDFVIYRELTSGIYFGKKEILENNDAASDLCYYHLNDIEPITHLAFKAALTRRKKLCLIDKANVLETSRLWRKIVQRIALQYPDVELRFMYVDNAAMQIIVNPAQFDVILTENMFGDILSDEASVLSGSLGLAPSASIGNAIALFEPIHGSYPQAANKNIANPMAAILSAAMLLDYFQATKEANEIRTAVETCLHNGWVTIDLNENNYLGTTEVGAKIEQLILG